MQGYPLIWGAGFGGPGRFRSGVITELSIMRHSEKLRRSTWIGAGLILSAVSAAFSGLAVADNPNERVVPPAASPLDPPGGINSSGTVGGDKDPKPEINPRNPKAPGIWVLDFKFSDPRIVKVDIPGRGQRICWYLKYSVTNHTGEPRYFLPEFELKTQDRGTIHKDHILPKVQQAIVKLEDPTADPYDPESGYLRIRNSVTIAREPIPVSTMGGPNKPIHGVAIWDDVDPDAARYSIFITGLSNGIALADPIPPSKEQTVRRKTLQINFKRLGDKYNLKSEEIRFVPPAQWIYRATDLQLGAVAGINPLGAPPAQEKSAAPGQNKPD